MNTAQHFRRFEAVTGSTKYLTSQDHDKIFTNRGGGACTWYLPALADIQAGWHITVVVVAAGDNVISAPADTIVLFNDATATSLTIGTNGEEIGNVVDVWYDGTSYLLALHLAAEAVTTTVA